MAVLIDTSILGRLANTANPDYPVARRAVAELHRRGEAVHVTAQNLVEFRNFATRPLAANGLGLTPAAAACGLAPAGVVGSDAVLALRASPAAPTTRLIEVGVIG